MGFGKDRFRDFAIAYIKTAKHDMERAYDALEDESFNYAVFHAQQCVEKIVKATLEMEEVFSRDHDVSDLFTIFILKKEDNPDIKESLYEVLEIMEWFKGKWSLTRYPRIIDGKVKTPLEIFGREEALEAISKAQFVFDIMSKYLKEKYGLEL